MRVHFNHVFFSPGSVPAGSLQVVGPDGTLLSPTSTVTVGNPVNFGVEVTPGGTGTGGKLQEYVYHRKAMSYTSFLATPAAVVMAGYTQFTSALLNGSSKYMYIKN